MDETSLILGWIIGRRIAGQRTKIDGGLIIIDDGKGNVIINASGSVSIVNDKNGNATITGSFSAVDDGNGNVRIQ
jgi:hypothetical protein